MNNNQELYSDERNNDDTQCNNNKIPNSLVITTLCCLSTLGLRNKVVSSFSFFPPKPSGMILKDSNGKEIIFKKEYINKNFGIENITLRSVTNVEKKLSDLLVGEKKANIYSTWIESGKSKIPISCIKISPILNDDNENSIPLFIFSHGNGSDIGNMLHWFVNLSLKLNSHVLAYDYRSYGLSKGKPTEKGMYADIEAVYQYAIKELKIKSNMIFLLGQSIGSAPTVYLARKLGKKYNKNMKLLDSKNSNKEQISPLGGIIVQSGIASGLNALLAPDLKNDILCDVFLNYKNIRKVPFPILILHGTNDQVVHISNSQKLVENTKKNKYHPPVTTWWIEGATHNIPGTNPRKEYYQKIGSFINSII